MKKVAIFDEYYETSDELEKEVNDWIEKYKVKVISIDVKTYGYEVKVDEIAENTISWYATVVYEEN